MKTFLCLLMSLMGSSLPLFANAVPLPAAAQQIQEEELMKMERDAHTGLILITAMVNDVPMRMMLDTGATRTLLHKESAAKLKNVTWLNTSHMQFSSNSTQRPQMLVANLQAGPGLSPRHVFAVMDLSAVHSMMTEKIDGIIGMDVLGSLPFTFDFKKNEFYWGSPEDGALAPVYGEMERIGRMMVQPKCGEKRLRLLLDTGSVITRVPAADWAPGSAGEIKAQMGNVDATRRVTVEEGKPGDLEIAPGVVLRGVQPIFGRPGESYLLGLDAMKNAVLIHLPTERSLYGVFYMQP